MNKFFSYYSALCTGINTSSVFTFDPLVISIKKMLVEELKQIVFYIEKLTNSNFDMSLYRDKVIEFISLLIVNLDFNKESFFVIIQDLNDNKLKLEEIYKKYCSDNSLTPELFAQKSYVLKTKDDILKILNEYERQNDYEVIDYSLNKKNLSDIIISLVLNACNCLIELKNFGIDYIEAKKEVLKLLNSSNFPQLSDEEWKEKIKEFSHCNYKITRELYKKIIEKYGPIRNSIVSTSKYKGKAILVSGNSLRDLYYILKAVENTDINIYTHHEMISAFQYEKLKQFKNLKGHYQRSINNFPLDFAYFPGPIYMSGNSIPKIDVIRGQIYTSAKYPAFGISKIENNDFKPLIDYAIKSNGFENDESSMNISVGCCVDEINYNIDKILKKINNKEIKKIVIIGSMYIFSNTKEYINDFIKNISNDTFIISFSNKTNNENLWNVNSFYDFIILYEIIEKLKDIKEDIIEMISIIILDCNNRTVSHIFNLIYLGIKDIFIGYCCPNIINPLLFQGLKDLFGINHISNAGDDIKKI